MKFALIDCYKFSTKAYKFDASKNYYSLLNIQQNSTKNAIRNAYLGLAKKYHPDLNPNGKEKFTLIQQAYQVLSNENDRKQYDEFYSMHINQKSQSPRTNASSQYYKKQYTNYRSYNANTQYNYQNPHKNSYRKYSQFKGEHSSYQNYAKRNKQYRQEQEEEFQDYDEYKSNQSSMKFTYENLKRKRDQWRNQFYQQFGFAMKEKDEVKKKRTQQDQRYIKMQFAFSCRNPFSPSSPKNFSQNQDFDPAVVGGADSFWQRIKAKFQK